MTGNLLDSLAQNREKRKASIGRSIRAVLRSRYFRILDLTAALSSLAYGIHRESVVLTFLGIAVLAFSLLNPIRFIDRRMDLGPAFPRGRS